MAEVDLPLALPIHLLAELGEGSYLSAELSPGSVALLLFRDRGLAERFFISGINCEEVTRPQKSITDT